GWDLPMMEAALSGLSLIAPAHSAYVSYLREEEVYLIPAPLGPARFEGKLGREDAVFFYGAQWWHPDEDAAADVIRRIVAGSAAPKRSPRERIAVEYSWEKAAAALLAAIGELPAARESVCVATAQVPSAPAEIIRTASKPSVNQWEIRGIELT